MPYRVIKLGKTKIQPHKAFMDPDFDAPTVIVTDQFDYVELWLKRNSTRSARLYWQQAENFYQRFKRELSMNKIKLNSDKIRYSLPSSYRLVCFLNSIYGFLAKEELLESLTGGELARIFPIILGEVKKKREKSDFYA